MSVPTDEVIVIEHPPEEVVKTSPLVVIAGFAVLGGVTLLALFAWASQGERNGQPDVFGKRVTVREVAERYKAAWSPGVFWPRDAFMHTKKTHEGSPLFKIVWTFLTGWFICLAFYLIFAGAISAIEVFREEAHLRAAMCVAAAFCLCAVWPVLFRIGSRSERNPEPTDEANANANAKTQNTKPSKTTDNANIISLTLGGLFSPPNQAEDDDGDGKRNNNSNAIVKSTVPLTGPRHSATKEIFLWISFGVLLLAAILAVAGSALIQAWTLPGPQFGTLLFLGPGYGLFAGWLLFAAGLNLRTAISYNSYPSGTLPWPETRTEYTHRGSLWPPILSLVISLVAVLIPDPAIPLPMLVAIFLFTPRQKSHLAASAVCLLGIVVATALVVWKRSE